MTINTSIPNLVLDRISPGVLRARVSGNWREGPTLPKRGVCLRKPEKGAFCEFCGIRHGWPDWLGFTFCVRYAAELGYEVTMVKDASADYSDEMMHAALDINIPNYANAVVTSDPV